VFFTGGYEHDVKSPRSPRTDDFGALGDWSKTAANKFGELWRRAMLIKRWQLEYQANSWELVRPASSMEKNLFEARFHLATAKVMAAATRDNLKARAEIGQAERYLLATRSLLAGPILAEIASFDRLLDPASMKPLSVSSENLANFEKIKTDLDRLIAFTRAQKFLPISTRVDA
jgi:hypothetical protein